MHNKPKITTLKTILMLSVVTMMILISGGIIPVHAVPGNLLLTINNPTPDVGDQFGRSVSLYEDKVLVGAWGDNTNPNKPDAYLFDVSSGTLLTTFTVPTSTGFDEQDQSVFLFENNVLIGASREDPGGLVYLYDVDTGNLIHTFENPTPQTIDRFGYSVSMSENNVLIGSFLDHGAGNEVGAAYLFDAVTGQLIHTLSNPTPDEIDRFGTSVSISGSNMLIGSPRDDAIAPDGGVVHLFDTVSGNYIRTFANPEAETNDVFGASVSISDNLALISSSPPDNSVQGYLYDVYSGDLLHIFTVPAFNTSYGAPSVFVSDNKVLIGTINDESGRTIGLAYLFDVISGELLHIFENPTPVNGDWFGASVSLYGDNVIIGASHDMDVGTAYLFEGIPTLYCGEPELYYNVINGTESSDYLVGTNSPDLIFGNSGNDTIYAFGEDNCIYAGDGDDFVLTHKDDNIVYGGTGNDSILLKGTGIAYGEDGNDAIHIIKPSAGHLIDGGNDYDLCTTNTKQTINTVNCEIVNP